MSTIVKWTNRLGLLSVVFLLYWVFCAIVTGVFGLTVFQENTGEALAASVAIVISLMAGCLMLNIMLNLSQISATLQKRSDVLLQSPPSKKTSGLWLFVLFVLSFPILAALMFVGDFYTKVEKQGLIIAAAQNLIESQSNKIEQIAAYSFSTDYIDQTADFLKTVEKIEKSFPHVSVIVKDTIDGQAVFLSFSSNEHGQRKNSSNEHSEKKKQDPEKSDYIYSTSVKERVYLESVFSGKVSDYRYDAHDSKYELYYPVKTKSGKIVVIYLNQYSRYGKVGSS